MDYGQNRPHLRMIGRDHTNIGGLRDELVVRKDELAEIVRVAQGRNVRRRIERKQLRTGKAVDAGTTRDPNVGRQGKGIV